MRPNNLRATVLRFSGISISVLAPMLAILSYFPFWIADGGEGVLPGFTLLLLCVAALPLYRLFKRALESLASYTLWLVSFIVFLLLSSIAEQMTVISLVGFISNALGAVLMKLGDRIKARED